MDNKQKMNSLLEEAYTEGNDAAKVQYEQQIAALAEKHKQEVDEAYQKGVEDTINNANLTPPTEDEDDGIPVHNIEPQATLDYLNEVPQEGYKQTDHSRVWPYISMVQERSDASWTEKCRPYCFYGACDKVVVECDDEPSQTLTPYKNILSRVYLLTPGKTYRWKMYKSGMVIDSGTFKAIGRVKWIGTKYPHNMRDLGFTGYIKYGRVYRSQNFLKVVVDDADYKVIREQLNITTQINLTTASDANSPSRTDIFDKCYNYNIAAYADVFTASKTSFKQALEALAKELKAGHNIVFNCWQGVDRTGTFAWTVQALCGLPLGYCEAGWELSSHCRDLNSKIWDEGGLKEFIKKLVDKYVAYKESRNEDTSYDAYALAHYLVVNILGVSEATIKTIREYLCE